MPVPVCDEGSAPGAERATLGRLSNGTFVPFSSGQTVPVEHGEQQGQHVVAALRTYAESGQRLDHRVDLRNPRGADLGGSILREWACAPGWTLSSPFLVFVDTPTTTPAVLIVETSVLEEGEVPRSFTASVGLQLADSP